MLSALCTPTASSSASSSATPPNSAALFSVSRTLQLDTDGSNPSLVGEGDDSIFVVGTFDRSKAVDDLIRIDLKTWRIAAVARFPNPTSEAYGDGALWWAAGQYAFDIPAPAQGRVLYKIDPSSLREERAFLLPGRTLQVTVAGTTLWVATRTALVRLDPESGRVLAQVPVSYAVSALTPSGNGAFIDILGSVGSRQFVTVYDATSGRSVARRLLPGATGGPLATTSTGVWIATDNLDTKSATVRYYQGERLVPTAAHGGYAADTSLYTGDGVIWSVDSGGQGPTECLDPSTGHMLARGGPLGVGSGSVATYQGRTYMLFARNLTNYFLRVSTSTRCR